jgi:hypothetical protein
MMTKLLLIFSLLIPFSCIQAEEVTGMTSMETRLFKSSEDGDDRQDSMMTEVEWVRDSEGGGSTLVVKIFGRYDTLDKNRTHWDIREANWFTFGEDWELRVGLGKVFWGVTEATHLVDIINQTDVVESVDGEAKLGQPLLSYTLIKEWGNLELFVLPYFRERRFDGAKSHLNAGILVDIDNTSYESSQGKKHIDFAMRYFHNIGDFDLGLHYFRGTNREPQFLSQDTTGRNDKTTLVKLTPYYDQIQQYGLDIQSTKGQWLFKIESILRQDSRYTYGAISAGVEYTFTGIFGSAMDLGVLSEFNRDSRHERAPTLMDKGLFSGVRLSFNDVQSSAILFGYSVSLSNNDNYAVFAEGSSRLGDNWTLTLDARIYASKEPEELLFRLKQGNHISMTLNYHF